ncbi:MAG: HipA family kinase [Chloroflexota bacterium]
MLRTVRATRYVEPLREGGSLPAIVEADDDGTYVLKFRGAGQGPKALIAELVAGEIGRALGLPVPELVFIELDVTLGRSEPDFEIQALIKASAGLNLALDFLPGSLGYDPLASPRVDPALAAAVVWFDAYITNVDRTPRNPNILLWHKCLYLIDHGAALYFHHSWNDYLARSRDRFRLIKSHVLLSRAGPLAQADTELRPRLSAARLEAILAAVPDEWLRYGGAFAGAAEARAAYLAYLLSRLEGAATTFVEEAERARAALL